ncbi:MAG: DUF308 domain-containing protein [Ruminococcus sp.]|nr:DUF308 domain-containing protein [Ruminococcus sp.]
MKNLKFNINGILLSVFEITVGILLLINPISFTSGIICVFGIALVVLGIVSVIRYFKSKPEEAAVGRELSKGIIAAAAGVFCIVKTEWLITIFPLLTIAYGMIILLAGISKIQWTVDMLRLKRKRWFLPAIGALFSIICAIIILNNPFASTTVLWIFTGIALIIEAIFSIVIIIINGLTESEKNVQDEKNVQE